MVRMTSLADTIQAIPVQSMDTALADSFILGFDTETTGTISGKDSIVSASLVLRYPHKDFTSEVTQSWVINPRMPMHPAASRVNGFTDEFLATHGANQVDSIHEISDIIIAFLLRNIPVLSYNAPFDIAMLNGDMHKIGLADVTTELRDRDTENFLTHTQRELLVLDPLVIDRAVSHRPGPRKLIDTTQYYGVYPHGDFHTALADTVATVDVMREIIRLHDDIASLELTDLMPRQRFWYEQWQTSFNEYLRSKNRPQIKGSWL